MKGYKKVEVYTCNKCNVEVNGFTTDHCDICESDKDNDEYHLCRDCVEKVLRPVDIKFGNHDIYFNICEDCFKKTEVATMIKQIFKLFRDIKLEWSEE